MDRRCLRERLTPAQGQWAFFISCMKSVRAIHLLVATLSLNYVNSFHIVVFPFLRKLQYIIQLVGSSGIAAAF